MKHHAITRSCDYITNHLFFDNLVLRMGEMLCTFATLNIS
jgi:hypothetical protein